MFVHGIIFGWLIIFVVWLIIFVVWLLFFPPEDNLGENVFDDIRDIEIKQLKSRISRLEEHMRCGQGVFGCLNGPYCGQDHAEETCW